MKAEALIIMYLILCAVLPAFAESDKPETVSYVDLKKYTGLWYEISRMPNWFQSDCAYGTTAEYRLREDGRFDVINSCMEKDGSRKTAEGVAKIVDAKTNARLKVSFFSILGIRPFWGDYWIIGLEKNYRWAVIGTPDRKYGWILSRTSLMSESDMQEVRDILIRNGYNPADFIPTKQQLK